MAHCCYYGESTRGGNGSDVLAVHQKTSCTFRRDERLNESSRCLDLATSSNVECVSKRRLPSAANAGGYELVFSAGNRREEREQQSFVVVVVVCGRCCLLLLLLCVCCRSFSNDNYVHFLFCRIFANNQNLTK